MNDLLDHVSKLHTTKLGAERIKRNLSIEVFDPVAWCKNKIVDPTAEIERQGKNWYIGIDGVIITVNAYNLCIITAHRAKARGAKKEGM